MALPRSRYVDDILPSGIRAFFDLVASSKGVISLGVGEPDFATPWHIRDEAIYSIERGQTSYTSNQGMDELRHLISGYYADRFSVNYDADAIDHTSEIRRSDRMGPTNLVARNRRWWGSMEITPVGERVSVPRAFRSALAFPLVESRLAARLLRLT